MSTSGSVSLNAPAYFKIFIVKEMEWRYLNQHSIFNKPASSTQRKVDGLLKRSWHVAILLCESYANASSLTAMKERTGKVQYYDQSLKAYYPENGGYY